MFTKVSVVALFASLAAAQIHPPVGDKPIGNEITRPLNEVVSACKPFTITWKPSTPNTVSVLLLKGPSTNVVKFGPSIAEGIANSGSLQWTPAADLEATAGSPTGYGIQIIDDVTGQYQYSTQFGISKEACGAVSSVKPSSTVGSGYPVSTPSSAKSSSAGYPVSSPVVSSAPPKSTLVYSTGGPAANSTVIQPTKSMSVPSSLKPSSTGPAASTSKLPEATGAASALQAGAGLLGAVAAFAFML